MHRRLANQLVTLPIHRATLPLLCAWCLCAWCLSAVACAFNVPEPIDPDVVTWTTYTDQELGFSLRHPDAWVPRRLEGFVAFVDGNVAPMRVSLLSREEARRRGYWGRNEPLSEGQRGQTIGELFRYRHFDGPIYNPFLTWVVPHRGLELAVELHTRNQDLDAVQSAIVDSLVLEPASQKTDL